MQKRFGWINVYNYCKYYSDLSFLKGSHAAAEHSRAILTDLQE